MRTRVRRRPALMLGLVAMLALLVGPAGVFASLQATGAYVSPATGHAEVIAHGVAQMPDSRIAWKVSQRSAKVVGDEPLGNYPLGFAYAATDPIVVNDYDTGAQTELAAGQAVFVAGGATQQHASLGGGTVSYTQIAVVGQADAPNADNVFDAPSGSRAISLVRDVLGLGGENTNIPDSGAPVLVRVVSGTLDVSTSSGQQSLKSGDTAVLSGDLTLTQTGTADATFVAAVIGDQVPAAPRFSGTITLQIFGCPAGTTTKSLPAPGASGDNPCDPIISGVELALKTPDGKNQSLTDAAIVKDPAGAFRWTVPFGDYEVQTPSKMPATFTDSIFVGSDDSILKTATASLSRDNPDVTIALYLMVSDTGQILADVVNCPPGLSAVNFVASACRDIATSGFEITLSSDALTNGDLSLKDAEQDGSHYTWTKLPRSINGVDGATYTVTETVLPAGFNDYLVSAAAGGNGAPWTVDLSTKENPNAAITIYNFQGSPVAGTVTVDTLICPTDSSPVTDCTRGANGPAGLVGISIDGPEALTNANATQVANSPFAWITLPFGDYTMAVGNLAPPAGYEIVKVQMTPNGANPGDGFTLSESDPIGNIIVFLVPTTPVGTPVAG